MIADNMGKRKWIQYEDETFEPVAEHENINLKGRQPGRDWFVVDKDPDWLPKTFAKEAAEPRHKHEPWFPIAQRQQTYRHPGIVPERPERSKSLLPRESFWPTSKGRENEPSFRPEGINPHARQEGTNLASDLYGDLPWNPHLHTGHAAASLTTGKVRSLSGTGGSAVAQGALGAQRSTTAEHAPLSTWEKFQRNMARAAEHDKKTIYDHSRHMTEEKWDKARKVTTSTLLAAPLAIPAGAASGLATYGAIQGGGTLLNAGARAVGAGTGLATTVARHGKSLLRAGENVLVRHPNIQKGIEVAADVVTPPPPSTYGGKIIYLADKTKEMIDKHPRPWED
ncbi:MAG: hypothetical protein AB7E32_09700 [Desulfovibrio sp.]